VIGLFVKAGKAVTPTQLMCPGGKLPEDDEWLCHNVKHHWSVLLRLYAIKMTGEDRNASSEQKDKVLEVMLDSIDPDKKDGRFYMKCLSRAKKDMEQAEKLLKKVEKEEEAQKSRNPNYKGRNYDPEYSNRQENTRGRGAQSPRGRGGRGEKRGGKYLGGPNRRGSRSRSRSRKRQQSRSPRRETSRDRKKYEGPKGSFKDKKR